MEKALSSTFNLCKKYTIESIFQQIQEILIKLIQTPHGMIQLVGQKV